MLDIDTVGTFNMSRAAFESLKKTGSSGTAGSQKGGLIINISATLHYGATWYQSHASAAKVVQCDFRCLVVHLSVTVVW